MHKYILATFILILSFSINSYAGQKVVEAPLGLDWGMKKSELQKYKTNKCVVEDGLEACYLIEPPKSLSFGDEYLVIFDFDKKLQKIVILSKEFSSDIYGREGKDLYEKVKLALTKKYGSAKISEERTGLKLYDESDEFYQCLKYSGCGIYGSIWGGDNLKGTISAEIKGLGRGSGFLKMSYESPYWNNVVDTTRSKNNVSDEDAL